MCSSAKTGGWFLYNKYLTVEEIQLATIFYIREDSQPDNILSSREVSVDDSINLYGSAPSNYKYMSINNYIILFLVLARLSQALCGLPAL
jgi:hypothetical protein